MILGRLELNLGEPRIFAPREVIGGLDHPFQDRFPESHGDRFIGLVGSKVVDLGRIVDPVIKLVIFVEAVDVGPLLVPAGDLVVNESIEPLSGVRWPGRERGSTMTHRPSDQRRVFVLQPSLPIIRETRPFEQRFLFDEESTLRERITFMFPAFFFDGGDQRFSTMRERFWHAKQLKDGRKEIYHLTDGFVDLALR